MRPDFGSYLRWLHALQRPQVEVEWQQFVNGLAANLTSYFREEHHFQLQAAGLRDQIDHWATSARLLSAC